MKRLVSIVMASVMMVLMMSTGLTAMAQSYSGTGEQSAEVYAVYKTVTKRLTPVYSIEIDWGTLKIYYTKAYKEVWNNTTHSIKPVEDDENTGWTTTSFDVSITNNSNVGIQYYFDGSIEEIPGTFEGFEFSDTHLWLNPGESISETFEFEPLEGFVLSEDKLAATISVYIE